MGDGLRKFFKWLVYAGAACIMSLALLVGIARLLLPLIPEYQEDIRGWAAAATGFDVQFENISASWPFAGPELRFIDVTLSSQESGEQIVVAKNLTVGISLLMLIRDRKAMLNRIGVKGVQIRVRRDKEGRFLFQDRSLDEFLQLESDPDKPLRLPDLQIELSEIEVLFADETRSGTQYAFGIEQSEIELSPDQARIDGEVDLDSEFGQRIKIVADFPIQLLNSGPESSGNTDSGLAAGPGQEWRVFVDGEDLRLGNIFAYMLNRESSLSTGRGDISISAAFVDQQPHSIATELDLTDVALRINADRSERYEILTGQFEWERDSDDGWLLAVRDISVERRDLFATHSDIAVVMQPVATGSGQNMVVNAEFLRLHDLYPLVLAADSENLLADIMPEDLQLPQNVYGDIQEFELNLSSMADASLDFDIAFQFVDMGIVAQSNGIAVRRVSGVLAADQDGGRVQIDSQDTEAELSAIFAAPIDTQSILGLLVWRVSDDMVHVLSDNIKIRMPYVSGSTRFELDWPRDDTSPQIKLTATGSATDMRQVLPLLPARKFPERVVSWLDRAIISGQVTRADINLSGPLRKFPFRAGEGVFYIDMEVENSVLDYAAHWPRISNLNARVVFDGPGLMSARNSGNIGGINFRNGEVRIADLGKGMLTVNSRQEVDVAAGLNFLRQSPIDEAIGPVLGKLTGGGAVDANLQLTVPVTRAQEYELEIVIDANGAELGMTGLDWGLTDIGGTLTVRNTRFFAENMTAMLLDEPITLNLHPAADSSDLYGQFIRVAGRTPIDRWIQALSLPFAGRLDGPAEWNALVLIPHQRSEAGSPVHILVRSDLAGVDSRLPDPLSKVPLETRALEVDIAFPEEGKLEIAGRMRDEMTWSFELESAEKNWSIARGAVHAGSATAIMSTGSGVELSGQLDFLRFDDWLDLAEDGSDSTGLESGDWQETWREAAIDIDRLEFFGWVFTDVQLEAHQDEESWQVALEGPTVSGRITVPLDLDSGRPIDLDMQRLWLVDTVSGDSEDGEVGDPRAVPSVNIEADDFVLNDFHFGALSTVIKNVAGGILIEPISMRADTFTIDGDGAWLVHPNDDTLRQTKLALSLNGTDIKAVLTALGYDPIIEGKSVVASGDLTWLGGPSDDFLERADGQFVIRMEEGSLLAVDPGGGRLLGVLSLAALPRRLSFDFSDVFDEGLSFDSLKGDFTVDDGHAYTCNLGLEGSVADMGIVGRAGFERRDYDQLAVVRPHVSNLLAVGGTVVGGPVAGAAMLLFSQIFRKPLSTLGESYYRVTGPWDDPGVAQISGSDLEFAPLRNCEAYLDDAITESLKE